MIFPFKREHEKAIIIRELFAKEMHKKVKRIKKAIKKEIKDSCFFDFEINSEIFTRSCRVYVLLKEKIDYEKQFADI